MKYALVDNQKTEAKKGLKGICRFCQQPVIAKCGKIRIDHWAHKSVIHCDYWWENETEWHREWKNKFPIEWQEIDAIDEETGEKHIADIKTDKGMVIEFQHSNISDEERLSRENFYKNMIWIVDGTRRKNDFKHFLKGFDYCDIRRLRKYNNIYIFQGDHLPIEWMNSQVPVFFDFKGLLDINDDYDNNPLRAPLWLLLPVKVNNNKDIYNILLECDRNIIIEMARKGQVLINYKEIEDAVIEEMYFWRYLKMLGYY